LLFFPIVSISSLSFMSVLAWFTVIISSIIIFRFSW
jgi:hypothetical protein